MRRTVQLIRDRFGYYHVSVFLLDDTSRWAVLSESTGVVGAQLKARGYRLGVGRLTVDLRDLDWRTERVVNLDVHLGAGEANVFVPARVCVAGTTHVGMGESEVAGERNDGLDVDHAAGEGSTAVPRLVIDASVDAGQLRVVNSDTADVDTPGYGPGPFHEDTAPQRAAEASACGVG